MNEYIYIFHTNANFHTNACVFTSPDGPRIVAAKSAMQKCNNNFTVAARKLKK